MTLPLYDAHNHLQDDWLKNHHAAVFADLARLETLKGAVVNGTEESDWSAVTALAREHAWVRPSFGIHPWDVPQRTPQWQDNLQRALDESGPRTAIGEIGLDRLKPGFDLTEQRGVFVAQLRLAAQRNLPASIHCVQAWGMLEEIVRREPVPARGFLIHAYGGPPEMVSPYSSRGAYFSFNGGYLNPRSAARREIFKRVPIKRLLVETDAPSTPAPPEHAPFTLPSGPDGRRMNHPANIEATYRALAELRGMKVEELAARVEENFLRLFG